MQRMIPLHASLTATLKKQFSFNEVVDFSNKINCAAQGKITLK